jgi:conjugal transfer pilus assembly protein TrbC
MRRRLPLIAGTAFTGLLLGLAAVSGAQTVDGLDLAKVRTRAKLSPQEAEALTNVVARRGEALRREAADNAISARAAAVRYASTKTSGDPAATFDFDGMVAATAKQMAPDDAPRLVAFASLSMPFASLKAMIADVSRAGGVVVFRGLPGNSAKTFTTALAKVLPPGEVKAAVGIDPRLFRAFDVEAVPAYIVTATDFDLCDGFDCRTTLPPHDRMDGNVTLAHALDTFARGDGPGARVAAVYRARLGEAQ